MSARKITRAIANILADKIKTRIYKEQRESAVSKDEIEKQIKTSDAYKEYEIALAAVEAAQDFANQKKDVVADLCAKLAANGPYEMSLYSDGRISIYFRTYNRDHIADEIILNSFVANEGTTVDDLVDDVYTSLSF